MPYQGGYGAGALQKIQSRWDFAKSGGAISTIALPSDAGPLGVPANSVVMGGFINNLVIPVGASGTIAAQVEAAGDLVAAATAISGAPWSTTGMKVVIPVFTVATAIKTTAARDISIVIATTAMTAGFQDFILFYVPLY